MPACLLMPKGIDLNKALEILLSPYPRQGATILGLIDTSFEKFLPDSPLDPTELAKLFTYTQWQMKLPERVRVPPLGLAAPVEPSETVSMTRPAPVMLEPKVHVPVTPIPLPKQPAPPEVVPELKPVYTPPSTLRIGGGVGPTIPTSAAPASYPPPKPQAQQSKVMGKPPTSPLTEPKARPLGDILGNFMRTENPDAKPLALPKPEEPEPADSEEPILSTGVSESTLSVIDKLRQRRAALADIIEKGEEEEVKHSTVTAKPLIGSRPAGAAVPAPTSLFTSPKEWFDAKAKRSFYFTKFAFRLTPDEKKYKEYVVGVGEFAPKNFILRSAVLEVKVRLMKDETEAIGIFWDWLKRGIIDEEKQVGESDQI